VRESEAMAREKVMSHTNTSGTVAFSKRHVFGRHQSKNIAAAFENNAPLAVGRDREVRACDDDKSFISAKKIIFSSRGRELFDSAAGNLANDAPRLQ